MLYPPYLHIPVPYGTQGHMKQSQLGRGGTARIKKQRRGRTACAHQRLRPHTLLVLSLHALPPIPAHTCAIRHARPYEAVTAGQRWHSTDKEAAAWPHSVRAPAAAATHPFGAEPACSTPHTCTY